MKTIIPTILLAFSLLVFADDKTYKADKITIAGREYEKVTIKLESAITASINHDAGGGRIEASKLPPEIQAAIGFDPAAASEALTKNAETQNKALKKAKAEAAAITMRYEVAGNDEEGLLVYIYKETTKITNIPTASSSVGGGGGKSISSKVWEHTYDQAFIPHTEITRALPTGKKFFAKAIITTETKRFYESDLYPVHKILSISDKP